MNKKSIIFNSIIAGLAALVVLVMLLPIDIEGEFSVFSLAQAFMAQEDGLILALPLFFAFASAIIILIFAILTLLTVCNVIKSAKAGKAFKIVSLVFACISTLFTAAVFAMFMSQGALLVGLLISALLFVAMIVLISIDLAQSKSFNKNVEPSQENPQ